MSSTTSLPTFIQYLPQDLQESYIAGDERLRLWAQAFEGWLEKCLASGGRDALLHAQLSWREFLQHTHNPPWSIIPDDIKSWELHLTRLIKYNTAHLRILRLASYYDYLIADNLFQPPNPARKPPTGRLRGIKDAIPLCQEEVDALLAAIDREDCTLARRDYAIFLTILQTIQKTTQVRELRWSQISLVKNRPWVTWRRGVADRRELLPIESWDAIHDYLIASNRINDIKGAHYIFAPLHSAANFPGDHPEDWDPTRPVTRAAITQQLRQYGAWAELEMPELRLTDLLYTAILDRFDSGASLQEINRLQGLTSVSHQRRTISILDKRRAGLNRRQAALKGIQKGPLQRAPIGGPIRHGLYARELPTAEVLSAVEAPKGLDWAVANLEVIMERCLEALKGDLSYKERLSLMDAYGLAASRLSKIQKDQRLTKKDKTYAKIEEQQRAFDQAIAEVHDELVVRARRRRELEKGRRTDPEGVVYPYVY